VSQPSHPAAQFSAPLRWPGVSGLPRLIATDLDGTLTRPDGSVSARSAQALAAVSAAGSHVLLVTGRPVRWLMRVYAYLPEPYPAVCANGAVLFDPVVDAIVSAHVIPADDLRRSAEALRAELPDITFAAETDGGRRMLHEAAYPILFDPDDANIAAATLDEICSVPVVKLLVRANGWDPDELTAAVRGVVGDELEATHSSRSGLVELSAAGITKATGLAAYAGGLGLGPADVLVFGDMPNDLPMFAWADGRAVAVANAHPAVLAAAGDVTAANTEDGVAAYLERLLDA
jgi:Cof subfamily protein (haloacid dehalogenase superfamily)